MLEAKIAAISYWLPEKKLTNSDIHEIHPEWAVEKIANKTGIYERRIADKDTFVSDMAVRAAERLFQEYEIDRSVVDFLIICTQSPDYFLPTTACLVQERLGLSTSVGALDFNLGCSGYVYGLGIAKGLLLSNSAKNILLITSETYSKYIHANDKSNKTIFGDGASATLISTERDGFKIGELVYGTDGRGGKNLIVKNGGIKNRFEKGLDILDDEDKFLSNDDFLYMNGSEIFKFTSENVPILVDATLRKNKLNEDAIGLYVFHQANRYMLDFIRKKMKIDANKFYYFLESCGNTVSSTIPIALSEALNSGKIKPNQKILLAGFGVGYSWAGCVIENQFI